ncbi:MAG: hypothetical protein COB09_19100 [Thalassobium sp.]|nr:MAG: hypothetical protein COB09_19100 [Thalassobium sp.]
MTKIPRKTQEIFGLTAGATGITEYGSPASGTPVYSTDLSNIQTADWATGWAAAALAGTEIPTFQDFNAIHFVMTNQIGYVLQEGIPEYDTGTEYHANSIVKKTATYELYGSKINTNQGNALPSQADNASWEYLGDISSKGQRNVSSEQTIVNAGTLTVAHTLSAKPDIVVIELVCQTAEHGYSIGDRINYTAVMAQSNDNNQGLTLLSDATDIFVQQSSSGVAINKQDSVIGTTVNITLASWRMVFTSLIINA